MEALSALILLDLGCTSNFRATNLRFWGAVMLRTITCLLILMLLSANAQAEKRVALVIGNGDYGSAGKLANPTRDASAIEALLQGAGFDVVDAKRDLGAVAMRRALRNFSDRVRDADIALVFYAGHGIEVNGINYLLPVDAKLERDIDVEDETVPLDRVIQILAQAKRLRLVILDACRDNPFARSMKRTLIGRSIGRGLASVDVLTSDTLIAFAAKAGSTAADGTGTNSPYTLALAKHLTTPGLDLRLALGRVRDEVLKSTGNSQEPFVYGSLGGTEIALVPSVKIEVPPNVPEPKTQNPSSEAERSWALAKDSKSIAALEAFIRRYGDTYYGDLAKLRLSELKHAETLKRTTEELGKGPGEAKKETTTPTQPGKRVPGPPSRSGPVGAPDGVAGASFKYWPNYSVPTGQSVTTTTADGRQLTCVGGDRYGTPRRCRWN